MAFEKSFNIDYFFIYGQLLFFYMNLLSQNLFAVVSTLMKIYLKTMNVLTESISQWCGNLKIFPSLRALRYEFGHISDTRVANNSYPYKS